MIAQFHDRTEAGRMLAEALSDYAGRNDVVVLGLPRGGIPVAYEVAQRLDAPLDVLIVRKIGLPQQPELAMGAIASGGVLVINQHVVDNLRVPSDVFDAVAARERAELARREHVYRSGDPSEDLAGKTVILVDDGIATGSTIRAAALAVKQRGAARTIIATPTASPDACQELRREVDEVVAVITPREFAGVGQWYADFRQTDDEEVTRLLRQARQRKAWLMASHPH
jgi:putative phosphoribosyl transferase